MAGRDRTRHDEDKTAGPESGQGALQAGTAEAGRGSQASQDDSTQRLDKMSRRHPSSGPSLVGRGSGNDPAVIPGGRHTESAWGCRS